MTREIKVGDKVRIKNHPLVNPDYVGRVCMVASVTNGAYIKFSDCDSNWHPEVLELIERCDRKTEFLQKLGVLLKEFDAEIGDRGMYEIEGVEITFGNDTPPIRYAHSILTADNIMDFEKE